MKKTQFLIKHTAIFGSDEFNYYKELYKKFILIKGRTKLASALIDIENSEYNKDEWTFCIAVNITSEKTYCEYFLARNKDHKYKLGTRAIHGVEVCKSGLKFTYYAGEKNERI